MVIIGHLPGPPSSLLKGLLLGGFCLRSTSGVSHVALEATSERQKGGEPGCGCLETLQVPSRVEEGAVFVLFLNRCDHTRGKPTKASGQDRLT